MSFATLVGVLLGFGLFVGSVMLSTDNYMLFLNAPSIVMVLGGTVASTLISYEVRPLQPLVTQKAVTQQMFFHLLGGKLVTSEDCCVFAQKMNRQRRLDPFAEALQ